MRPFILPNTFDQPQLLHAPLNPQFNQPTNLLYQQYQEQQLQQQLYESQEQQREQNRQNKELMNLIVNLNESIRVMGCRFESFQKSVEGKMSSLQNENVLLKNKVDFLHRNFETRLLMQQKELAQEQTAQASHNPYQAQAYMTSTTTTVEVSPIRQVNIETSKPRQISFPTKEREPSEDTSRCIILQQQKESEIGGSSFLGQSRSLGLDDYAHGVHNFKHMAKDNAQESN